MKTIRVRTDGETKYRKTMPASECMMHLGIVDQEFVLTVSTFGMVQLYKDGKPFSSKVTCGEAGIMWDNAGYYFDKEVTEVNSIQVPERFVELASTWYSGSDSMLYAITSTGNLTTGGIRPNIPFEGPMSDEEWYVDLFDNLSCELYHLLKMNSQHVEKHKEELTAFMEWAEEQADILRHEYGID